MVLARTFWSSALLRPVRAVTILPLSHHNLPNACNKDHKSGLFQLYFGNKCGLNYEVQGQSPVRERKAIVITNNERRVSLLTVVILSMFFDDFDRFPLSPVHLP